MAGKTYPPSGIEQGRAVLMDLAHHPATAKHIATKLATHFVADQPPQALVDRLGKRFLDTGGDLMEVTKALVTAPEAWDAPRSKLKKPGGMDLGRDARLRARASRCPPRRATRRTCSASRCGGRPSPKGFSDDSAAWLDGLAERLDIANALARRIGNDLREPDAMVDAALGPLASAETRQTIKRAESRPQALALLLMAPEFQRR